MCGICGIAYRDRDRPVDLARLRAMRRTLEHRGPDGEGLEHWAGVGFGHRRLAIIDVAGGRQPLANEDGTVWVTFNGEIYNYRALAAELAALGHVFRTRSDTEVLVHAYEAWGVDFARRLNGIFALALYDAPRRRVVLARDHVGVKPLFYSITPEGLFFGSEPKAVLAGTGLAARPSPEALSEYLVFRYVAGERSFFDGVHRLPPAHVGVWQDGALALQRYWEMPEPGPVHRSLDAAAEELDALLAGSVDAQMMSEVPLGTFCSGGVDSGLVTGYAAAASPHRLHTFSVQFDDPRWSEGPLAADTAARYGTEHHGVTARAHEFARLLPRLAAFNDEPLGQPNSVPLYVLSRFARQRVTVVLTGEGADETFGGYPRYHALRLRAALERVPALRGALAGAAAAFPGHRARLLREQLSLSLPEAARLNARFVPPASVRRILRADAGAAADERRRLWERACVPGDVMASLSRYEISTYLGSLLDRIDRMSMAAGLEARVPFLDLPLLEWSATLSPGHRLRGSRNKPVVRRLAEGRLSPRITRGPKSGFGVPLDDWFRGAPLGAMLWRRLDDDAHPAAEHFDRASVRALAAEHRAGRASHGELLWLLLNVYLWHEVHCGAPAPAIKHADLAPV